MTRKPLSVLLIQVDQLAAQALPLYGHPLVKAPNIQKLAESGMTFDAAYCNSPICGPSRYSMLTGQLPSSIDAFDNASELPASTPTLLHYFRALGYATTLCGKMHFVGPDQLHGYEERLVTDIYPADFAWTPNWLEGPRNRPTATSMLSVVNSGVCVRSLQMDYDDEVEFFAVQKIYDLARSTDERPFFMTVSFTHPHMPYTVPQHYWDMYRHDEIDMPKVPPIPLEEKDEYSRWLYYANGQDLHTVTDEDVRNARHAYYGMITYVDEKIGRLMSTLESVGLRDNTIVVFTGDHGEMLGERGMWYKQNFFEWSARVPLVISDPSRLPVGRVSELVSLVDLAPTLLDLVTDGQPPEAVEAFAGRSLVPLLRGSDTASPGTVISEYADMGVCAPCRMVRQGAFKYIYTHGYPGQLFDLDEDPDELNNLCGSARTREIEDRLLTEVLRDWDPEQIHRRILASQARRRFVQAANEKSPQYTNWSHVIRQGDEHRFVRHGGAKASTGTKARARFPYVAPKPPDKA